MVSLNKLYRMDFSLLMTIEEPKTCFSGSLKIRFSDNEFKRTNKLIVLLSSARRFSSAAIVDKPIHEIVMDKLGVNLISKIGHCARKHVQVG